MILALLRAVSWKRASTDADEHASLARSNNHQESALETLDLQAIHAAHGDFVWLCLQRLGVRQADLPDVHQEVFLVVHRKLHTYDGRGPFRSWLFGICRGKAAGYRRLAWFRREQPTDALPEGREDAADLDIDAVLDEHKRKIAVRTILDKLDVDKRAVFVMFELEGLSCETIATTMGLPVGTVYSRLFHARKEFEKAARKMIARGEGAGL